MIMYSWFRVPIFGRFLTWDLSVSSCWYAAAFCCPFAFPLPLPPWTKGIKTGLLESTASGHWGENSATFGRCLFWDFGFDHQQFWDFVCPERETCFIFFLHFQSYFEHLLDGQVQVCKKNAKHCKTKVLRDLPNLVFASDLPILANRANLPSGLLRLDIITANNAPLPLPFSPEDSHSLLTWGNLYNKKGCGMLWIPGWWFHPLWKILVKWGYYSQYMVK